MSGDVQTVSPVVSVVAIWMVINLLCFGFFVLTSAYRERKRSRRRPDDAEGHGEDRGEDRAA